jgi:hypothetical protein
MAFSLVDISFLKHKGTEELHDIIMYVLTIIPGLSVNCLLTSLTTSCAVLPTAEQAHALNRNISIEPNKPPTKISGTAMSTCNNCVRTPNISKQIQYSKWHDVNTYCIPL